MIMIHTSYSGSTYNMQEDISDASVLLNKFNTGMARGLSNIASPSATNHWRDMLNHSSGTRIIYNTALSSYKPHLPIPWSSWRGAGDWTRDWPQLGQLPRPATTPSCSNVFIMNQYAQEGSHPLTSRTSIGAVLSAKAQNCFTVRGTGVCGDYVVTSGEQCDAGLLGDTCWTDACQLRSTAMCR
eukprot:Em0153g10a